MIYEGRIRLRGEHGNGLAVRLGLEGDALWLRADGQELGRWPVSKVGAQRLTGDRFSMVFDGEPVLFVAEDPVAFSYEALPRLRALTATGADGPRDGRPAPATARRLAGAIPAMLGAVGAALDRTPPPDPERTVQPEASVEGADATSARLPAGADEVESARQPAPSVRLELVHDAAPVDARRCAGITRAGTPCRHPALAGARFCHQHDPARQAARQAARVEDPRLRRMQRRVEAAIEAVRDGDMDPAAAHALANLARALCVIARTDALLRGGTAGRERGESEPARDVARGRR